ncbi:DUF222 domain-containing protein [Gordonia sp. CPCC 205515]|uniref:DUF222 domain-containing protein n=1 Tax=Gordonia sp. CPCC 205515 TaxID=3140791 RepID=UPI003AF3B8DB
MTSSNESGDSGAEIVGLYRELDDVLDRIAASSTTSAGSDEVLAVAESHERSARRLAYVGLRRVMDCSDRGVVEREGYSRLTDFMVLHLRITDPGRRRKLMAALLSMYSLTGDVLDPKFPNLAAAFAEGAIGPEHALTVIKILDKIPAAVEPELRDKAEEVMAGYARDHEPKELIVLGAELLAHLDPDGTLADDKDRARRRSLELSKQDADLMSSLEGRLDPVTRALLDVVLAAWAAPGMNMPGDPDSPKGGSDDVDLEVLKKAAERDYRTPAQRNHDALHALLDAVVNGGVLGKSHRGLPPHLIISITDTALRAQAGVATTASGALLPISQVIELAADAQQHLAVFKDHSAEPLYLGQAHRFANQAQRFMLFARDGAVCTCPNCTQPFTHLEAHHAEKDWAQGGFTDVIDLAGACGKHNRMVGDKPGQWSTHIIKEGPDAGRPAWVRTGRDGRRGKPQVNRNGIVGAELARRLRERDRPPDKEKNSRTVESAPSTGPPGKPEERRRVPRLVASGWVVNTLDL